MKYTIEDLRNGKCAVKNDGTVEDLRKVLNNVFKDCSYIGGGAPYYLAIKHCDDWYACDETDLPTQSVKDFLEGSISVTRQQLAKIHNVACPDWKNKIEKLIPFGEEITTITQSQIDEMFNAATKEQMPVLEEVFGEQEKELKRGDVVKHEGYELMVCQVSSYGYCLVCISGPYVGNRWRDVVEITDGKVTLSKLT